jgi:crossover junction endodeoxyribonuclease RusA
MQIELPWPPKELSPNARLHWAKKSKAVKLYRSSCGWIAKQNVPNIPAGNMAVKITFYPPDSRRRDRDNTIASFKAGQDGIADGWGVDDVRFNPVTYAWGPCVKGGKVIIEI